MGPRIFTSTDCKESCPGFSAPILNATSGGYYFEYCSGHGECDIVTQECSCDEGYTGSDCGNWNSFTTTNDASSSTITNDASSSMSNFGIIAVISVISVV